MNRVLILALDGLEYNLVRRFKLDNLKQKEYGKVAIPRECYRPTKRQIFAKTWEPWTPYVWTSYLTGKLPHDVGLTDQTVLEWKNPFLQCLRRLTTRLGLDKIDNKGIIAKRLHFKRKPYNLKTSGCATIFDAAKKPLAINVPMYCENWSLKIETSDLDEIHRIHWDEFKHVKKATLSYLDDTSWDLFMSYTKLLDTVGELCFSDFIRLFRAYNEVNQFVGEIQGKLDKDVFLLIISDHGIERFGNTRFGKHSDYGFYSLSKPLKLEKPETTDFYHIVTNILRNDKAE